MFNSKLPKDFQEYLMFDVFDMGAVLIDKVAESFLAFGGEQGTSRRLVLFINLINEVDLESDD